jgi:hypothetical protein
MVDISSNAFAAFGQRILRVYRVLKSWIETSIGINLAELRRMSRTGQQNAIPILADFKCSTWPGAFKASPFLEVRFTVNLSRGSLLYLK